jgi:hypothetical protein
MLLHRHAVSNAAAAAAAAELPVLQHHVYTLPFESYSMGSDLYAPVALMCIF